MSEAEDQWDAIVQGLLAGDDQICNEFWGAYGDRLSRLAEHRLPASLKRRVGPEDIVQSACRTFFRRVQGRKLEIGDQDMLWPLLCAITINKVRMQIRFHGRQRRNPRREATAPDNQESPRTTDEFLTSGELSPQEAAMFAEQMEDVLSKLSEEECTVVEMKLAECSHQEIADKLLCSERTVRRIVAGIRTKLHDSLSES